MSSSLTATAGGTSTEFQWKPTPPPPVETADLFDAVVIGANQLELRPRTELAKSLLHMWLGGEAHRSGRMRGNTADVSFFKYGAGFEALSFTFESKPMLSSGDDPYYTGMTISADEQKACRELVDEMRRPKQKPRKKGAR